jgi:hypothetical protein
MRIDQPPLPLDISRLNVGPPIKDGAHDESNNSQTRQQSRALVAYHDGDLIAKETALKTARALGDTSKLEQLPPPDGKPKVPDVRHMTPRQMQDYSQNLYAAGVISYDDYAALAFQPELHPDFQKTIGALTGEKAEPDRPRDYIEQWRDRVDYTQRYYPANAEPVRQAHRIHEALLAFPKRTDIFV